MKKPTPKFDKVEKRDGRIVNFNQEKITDAIWSAARAVGGSDKDQSLELSNKVVRYLRKNLIKEVPHVEDIQDAVEKVLIEEGHARTAKAYILYRKQHEYLRKIESTKLEVERLVDDYLSQRNWRVRENSNAKYSMQGLYKHAAGRIITNYSLDRIYSQEISKAHRNGDFHIHDLSYGLSGYCAGWSLENLLINGFNGVSGHVASDPPKHLDTALLQAVNFLGTLQGEWAGAQALNSVDTLLAPFVAQDNLSYKEVKQAIQKFVFNLNVTSRWGGQSPFTNVTMDWVPPRDLAGQHAIIGGKPQDNTYAEYEEEMKLINRAFIEILEEGDASGRPFSFPIPTYNLTSNFDYNSENSEKLFKMTARYGLPYFSNFVNSDLDPSDIRSMCCRLRIDEREIERNVTGGLFGSGSQTGSLGVVTINLPRIGYLAKDEDDFFERLSHLITLACQSLEIKREVVEKNLKGEVLPYSKRYLGTLKNHFNTIGLVGGNELCENLLGIGIASEDGKKFAVKVLRFMLEKLAGFREKTDHLYNLEATPAEGTSYRLARLDKSKYPDIITAGRDIPYYTNSTHLPVNENEDLIETIEHQESLQRLYTGGTVLHTFIGEKLTAEGAKTLVKMLAEKSELPYYTITPTYSICPDHGYISGEHEKCPLEAE